LIELQKNLVLFNVHRCNMVRLLLIALGAARCTDLLSPSAADAGCRPPTGTGDGVAEFAVGSCDQEENEHTGGLDDSSLLQHDPSVRVVHGARRLARTSLAHVQRGGDSIAGGSGAGQSANHASGGAKAQARDFWTGRGGDPARTGASPYAVGVWKNQEEGPTWSVTRTGMHVKSVPLIDYARNVYLTSSEGHVYKFSESGQSLWNYSSAARLTASPTIREGNMFLVTKNGELRAIDLNWGTLRWRKRHGPCSAADGSSVTANEDVVVFALAKSSSCLHNDNIIAVSSKTGKLKWSYFPDEPFHGLQPAVQDDSVIFAAASGRAYRLDLATGKEIWKTDGPGLHSAMDVRSTSTIIGPNGVVYVTTGADPKASSHSTFGEPVVYLRALNFTSGKVLWSVNCAGSAPTVGQLHPSQNGPLSVVVAILGDSCPAVNAESVKALGRRSRLIALDAINGTRLNWTFAPADFQQKKPRGEDGIAPATSPGNQTRNPSKDSALATGSAPARAAGPRDHRVALETQSNETLEIPAGVVLNTDKTHPGCMPQSLSDPILAGDGTVYMSSKTGAFYAIRDQDGDGIINTTVESGEVMRISTGGVSWQSLGIATGMLVASSCDGVRVFKDF